MKKILTMFLALAMLLPLVLSVGTVVSAEEVAVKPFYGLGWSDLNRMKFPNLEGLRGVWVNEKDGVLTFGSGDPKKDAESVKRQLDAFPEGMRYMHILAPSRAFSAAPEDVIYMHKGVEQLKEQFTAFIKEYHAIGGKLEGIIIDVEYLETASWYIYSREYRSDGVVKNAEIYNNIVKNPRYATEIRPLLEEYGFKFYEEIGGIKSEIYSIYPYLSTAETEKYSGARAVWDAVMTIHKARYLNAALLEPMLQYYPDATLSDYQSCDTDAWLKDLSDTGEASYVGGNEMKIGNVSNCNTYANRPYTGFFADSNGDALYKNPPAFYKAVYEDDPYHMFMWDINKFKKMYAATDTKKINAWIAEYDYNTTQEGSVSNTPYYTETIFHIGMLNPEPFLVYMYEPEFTKEEYTARSEVISQILSELTRVAGYADRKPIETPAAWNDGFVLSGMYAGGRNIWRLTPDTTDGLTLADFKVKDSDPTFSINGKTITFPQGKIISDGEVGVVGTCGYWIETPANVNPVVTTDADRFVKNPAYAEDFEGYAAGSQFKTTTALPKQAWDVTASTPLLIQENGGSKVLELTGTAKLRNIMLPQNITAGDSYAKQQAWEISFTVSSAVNSGENVKLLTCNNDGGIKIENGALYYAKEGDYQQFSGVSLTAGQKYTVKRDFDFAQMTCSYSVYDAAGNAIAQAANVPITSISMPAKEIGVSCQNLSGKVLLDDYKLYPTGVAADFEVYEEKTGRLLETDQTHNSDVAYRLSWLNASSVGKTATVMVQYGNEAPQVLRKIAVAPGCDGVDTGIVENKDGKAVRLSVQLTDGLPEPPPTAPTTVPTTAPTTAPTAAPTTIPTTAPIGATETTGATSATETTGATVVTTAPTSAPTSAPTTAPTTIPTTAPTEASAPAPTTPADNGGSGSTIAIIVVIVLVIAGAAVGVFFYLKKKKAVN